VSDPKDLFFGAPVEPIEPSATMKSNIMSRLDSTPQLASEPGAHRSPAADRAQRRWFTRPAVAITGLAAAVALVVGGGVLANVIADYTFTQQQADKLAAINAAEDVERVSVDVGDASATLVWSVDITSAALIVEGMDAAPSDKTYQLWYIGEDGARPAGTFSVSADGEAWRVLDGDMAAGDTVGVTIEPPGGSEAPTSDPIMTIES
jgi:anti-sigma-K factor RskA